MKKFKTGDYVRVTKKLDTYSYLNNRVGKVTIADKSLVLKYGVYFPGVREQRLFGEEALGPATEEEFIKQGIMKS